MTKNADVLAAMAKRAAWRKREKPPTPTRVVCSVCKKGGGTLVAVTGASGAKSYRHQSCRVATLPTRRQRR